MLQPSPRPVKCRACPVKFVRVRPLQVACSWPCAQVVAYKARAKAERIEDKARREKLKTRSDHMKAAQVAVNRYVRLRDAGLGCISCGARPDDKFGGAMDCGHYLSRGSSPHLRFHLWNMALQCVKENRYLGGAAGKFRLGLIARIGLEKVETLESMQGPAKFTVEYLIRLKRVFTKKANRAEKRLMEQRA